jgi:2-hydroxychromene-2-carboxylate isomerase
MSLHFELYWSVRSPYSYLATPRLYRLHRDYDVTCAVRPVLPHALRDAGTVSRRNPLWLNYFKRDIVRTSQYIGLPLKWPNPDPVSCDPATGSPLPEQPHAHRLSRMVAAAQARERGLAFIFELSGVLWSPDIADWTAPGVLAGAFTRAGLDLAEIEADVAANACHYDAVIAGNDAAEHAAGHWGVPVMVFDGEPFFGQDRIDQLVWRLQSCGLTPRATAASAPGPRFG